jgi:hypothetical protein
VRETVRDLISSYLKTASSAVQLLRERCGFEDVFDAYQQGFIPRSGVILESEGWTYKFHGGGCYFCLGHVKIDVDFGPNGSADGFEAGKLLRFSQETLKIPVDYFELRHELQKMHDEGELAYPQLPPNSHLYFQKTS